MHWDRNSDGGISKNEAALVTGIDIVSDEIRSLKGIEYLPNLDTLRCRGRSYGADGGSGVLSVVDLKANAGITCLDLSNNRIRTLELAGLVRLHSLALGGNVEISGDVLDAALPFIGELRSLDISGNRALKEAYLSHSPIKTLYLTAAQKATLNLVCDPDTEIIVVERMECPAKWGFTELFHN